MDINLGVSIGTIITVLGVFIRITIIVTEVRKDIVQMKEDIKDCFTKTSNLKTNTEAKFECVEESQTDNKVALAKIDVKVTNIEVNLTRILNKLGVV